jgi:signal transduction protein with GAF and PtsI domain
VRPVEQAIGALDFVALEPFVARAAADIVAQAELDVREQPALGLEDDRFRSVTGSVSNHGIGSSKTHEVEPHVRLETVTHQG